MYRSGKGLFSEDSQEPKTVFGLYKISRTRLAGVHSSSKGAIKGATNNELAAVRASQRDNNDARGGALRKRTSRELRAFLLGNLRCGKRVFLLHLRPVLCWRINGRAARSRCHNLKLASPRGRGEAIRNFLS